MCFNSEFTEPCLLGKNMLLQPAYIDVDFLGITSLSSRSFTNFKNYTFLRRGVRLTQGGRKQVDTLS